MNSENWNPGHSVNRGYPYDFPISQQTFKDRPRAWEDDKGHIHLEWDEEKFDKIDRESLQDNYDFALHRLIDFQEALNNAEGQIIDILSEKHFDPEDHGFMLAASNEKATDQPLRVFVNKFDANISLFRKHGVPGDPAWNPSKWTLMRKIEDDKGTRFQEDDILLPCARIAYCALYSLGVKMFDETESPDIETHTEVLPAVEPPPVTTKSEKIKQNFYSIKFERDLPNNSAAVRVLHIPATNEEEAYTKASFHLQTEEGFDDIKRSELSLVTDEEIDQARKAFMPATPTQ